jgi:hypothetical protein
MNMEKQGPGRKTEEDLVRWHVKTEGVTNMKHTRCTLAQLATRLLRQSSAGKGEKGNGRVSEERRQRGGTGLGWGRWLCVGVGDRNNMKTAPSHHNAQQRQLG